MRTALAFPGFVSAIFLTLNFLVRALLHGLPPVVDPFGLLPAQRLFTRLGNMPGHVSPPPHLPLDTLQPAQVWGQRSSGAVPFGTLCALVFLWCGVSVPLCFVGSYFGYKKPAPEVRLAAVPPLHRAGRVASMLLGAGCLWALPTGLPIASWSDGPMSPKQPPSPPLHPQAGPGAH